MGIVILKRREKAKVREKERKPKTTSARKLKERKVTTSFMSIIGDISTVRDDDNYFKTSAMMTGSLPCSSSSSSSTSSSNGSKPVNDDQFVDDLVNGLNSLLKQSLTET